MANDLSINIKINSNTKAIEIMRNGFTELENSITKAESNLSGFSRKLADILLMYDKLYYR